MVAPDAVMLLTKRDQLTEEQYNKKASEVVAKGAIATALVCAGPVGWIGLAGSPWPRPTRRPTVDAADRARPLQALPVEERMKAEGAGPAKAGLLPRHGGVWLCSPMRMKLWCY
jgi:hypothetical protein